MTDDINKQEVQDFINEVLSAAELLARGAAGAAMLVNSLQMPGAKAYAPEISIQTYEVNDLCQISEKLSMVSAEAIRVAGELLGELY